MFLLLGASSEKLHSKAWKNGWQCLTLLTLERLLLMMNLNFPGCDLITSSPKQNEQAEQIIPFMATISGSAACQVSFLPSLNPSNLSQPSFAGYLQ